MTNRARAIVVCAALSLSGPAAAQTEFSRPRTDVVLEWNAITLSTVSTANGVEQVRLAAITHLAVFEAVNAIVGEFTPYLGTVAAPAGASAEAAAVAAAHGVLTRYLPDQADALDAAREISLKRIPDGPAKAKRHHRGRRGGAGDVPASRRRRRGTPRALRSAIGRAWPMATDADVSA